MTRTWAKELSSGLAPTLKENNIRLIGIGLEELGVEEFVNRKFFDGGKQAFFLKKKALSYKKKAAFVGKV